MWSLPSEDSAEALSNRLSTAWDHQVQMVKDGKKKKANLTFAIARAFGGPYLVAGLLKAGYDSLSFLQPQILRLLLRYVNSYRTDSPLPPVAGFSIAILMFVVANIATAMLHQYFDRCFTTGKSNFDFADFSYARQERINHPHIPQVHPLEQWREDRPNFWRYRQSSERRCRANCRSIPIRPHRLVWPFPDHLSIYLAI